MEHKKTSLINKRIQKAGKENKTVAVALDLSPEPSLSMKIKKNLAVPSSIKGAGIMRINSNSRNNSLVS